MHHNVLVSPSAMIQFEEDLNAICFWLHPEARLSPAVCVLVCLPASLESRELLGLAIDINELAH